MNTKSSSGRNTRLPLKTKLTGVFPVIQTPFTTAGDIDEPMLQRELSWVNDQGVAGVTTGMVSELMRLETGERRQLAEIVVGSAQHHKIYSIISVGAESTKAAVSHAIHAEKCGASAVMVNPPVTVGLSDEGLIEYFRAVIESVSIPVVVQDASGYLGLAIPIGLQAELLANFGEQLYFKPEASPIGPRLTLLREATEGAARVFEGTGGIALIDSHRRGIVGTMPGAEVCWAIQALWDAAETGDWDRAYGISGPLSALVSMQTTIDVFVAVEKYLLHKQGVIESQAVRGPSGFALDPETAAEVDRLFDLITLAVSR